MSDRPQYTFTSKDVVARIPLWNGWGLFLKLITVGVTVRRVFVQPDYCEYEVDIWGDDGIYATIDHRFTGKDNEQGALWALANAYSYLKDGHRYFNPNVESDIQLILMERLRIILTSQHGWWVPQLVGNFDFCESLQIDFTVFIDKTPVRVRFTQWEDDSTGKRQIVFVVDIYWGTKQLKRIREVRDYNAHCENHDEMLATLRKLLNLHKNDDPRMPKLALSVSSMLSHYNSVKNQ